MKKYDVNIARNYMTTKTFKFTLQFEDFKGHFLLKMGGNVSPLGTLLSLLENIQDGGVDGIVDVDSNLKIYPDENWFRCKLTNDSGDTCVYDDELNELEWIVVKAELVSVKEWE